MKKTNLKSFLTKTKSIISNLNLPKNINVELDNDIIESTVEDEDEQTILVQIFVSAPKTNNSYDYSYATQITETLRNSTELQDYFFSNPSINKEVLDSDNDPSCTIVFSLDKRYFKDCDDWYELEWN